jgi:hypothetical protein
LGAPVQVLSQRRRRFVFTQRPTLCAFAMIQEKSL